MRWWLVYYLSPVRSPVKIIPFVPTSRL
jgi:hypothetical protein